MQTLQEQFDELRVSAGVTGKGRVRSTDDPFILQLIHLLVIYGVQAGASDIHISPTRTGGHVRYRIDGILHDLLQLSDEIRDPLIRAIKTKANLATDAVGRSKPQDGRIDFGVDGKKLDLRLSSFPTLFGDVIAVRILDRSASRLSLEDLGFPPTILQQFHQIIHRPNGLLLVVGPTNSGKTTTLYAALEKIRSPQIKIVTLEDPVEYQMEGVEQAQINPQVGLTFASGLRAIMRQDANVILVGEIRDKETVDIAVRAALTGHLVFSTLHTRHACGAVTRLLDMEIEPHLITASLTGVLAMRLVRLVCQRCQTPDPTAEKTFARLLAEAGHPAVSLGDAASSGPRFVRGTGCLDCNHTGYHRRTGLFELLVLNDALRQYIVDGSSVGLYGAAVTSGMRTMLTDGLEKAARGLTTIAEVLRVLGESEDG